MISSTARIAKGFDRHFHSYGRLRLRPFRRQAAREGRDPRKPRNQGRSVFQPNPIACHRVQNGTASPSEKCRASRHHRTERIGKTMPRVEGTLSMLCVTSEECLKRRSDLSVEDGIDVLSNGGKPIDFATESCPAEIVFFHYIFFPISGLFISAMCFHHAAKAVSQQRSVRQPD